MSERSIYRKVALDRLASPEQLDQLMQVTNPAGWLSLVALGSLLLAAVAWSIFGSVPVEVSGRAILINTGGVKTVAVPEAGQIAELRVGVGDTVQEGQAVATLASGVEVRSPHTGRVLELRVERGAVVEPGTAIVSLEPTGDDVRLEAVAYLPLADARRVEAGMPAQISPDSVNREESGFLRGMVISVGTFPATRQGMLRVLGSEELVEALAQDRTPIEVRVGLNPAAQPRGGYQWSSSSSPDDPLLSGTLADTVIVIEQRQPISFVLPVR